MRRALLPDIDMESAHRLECYDATFERFGKERVAVTAMPEIYRARRALRDVGVALGIAPADINRIAKTSESRCVEHGRCRPMVINRHLPFSRIDDRE